MRSSRGRDNIEDGEDDGEDIAKRLDWARNAISSVALSPDGKRVVSALKMVRIWDAETGKLIVGPLKGHGDWVNSVAFSPDNTRIASGSDDATVRIWDAQTGDLVMQLSHDYENGVVSVAFSPDGRRVVSGTSDEMVRVWNVETDIFDLATHSKRGTSGPGPNCLQRNTSVLNLPFTGAHRTATIYSKGTSCVIDNFHIEQDGWILGPKSELLLWVPPNLRMGLYQPRDIVVTGRCIKTQINMEFFVHGDEWTRCGDPIG